MRAFTDADLVQPPDDGTSATTTSPSGLALAAGSTEGNAGILVLGAQTQIVSPDFWHIAAQSGTSAAAVQLAVLCRADLFAGETTWPFVAVGGSPATWAWSAQEWTNVSFAAFETASPAGTLATNPASISTGTTGPFTTEYVMGVAAVLVQGSATSTVWSAGTWSNGFTETDVMSAGTGQNALDLQLRVARLYSGQNDAGSWESTFTFSGGAQTGKVAYACLAVFRAESWDTDV